MERHIDIPRYINHTCNIYPRSICTLFKNKDSLENIIVTIRYRISGIFSRGFNFCWVCDSLKSPKIDTTKNKRFYTSSLRVLEIRRIGLSENLTHLPSVFFAKIFRCEKFPIYGIYRENYYLPSGIYIWQLWCVTYPVAYISGSCGVLGVIFTLSSSKNTSWTSTLIWYVPAFMFSKWYDPSSSVVVCRSPLMYTLALLIPDP